MKNNELCSINHICWVPSAAAFPFCFGINLGSVWTKTPPVLTLQPAKSWLSSSSFLMASWMCLGVIDNAFMESVTSAAASMISATTYSRTAAM